MEPAATVFDERLRSGRSAQSGWAKLNMPDFLAGLMIGSKGKAARARYGLWFPGLDGPNLCVLKMLLLTNCGPKASVGEAPASCILAFPRWGESKA
jgi:hypothetical protein